MIRNQIISSTSVDAHGQSIPLEELRSLAENFASATSATRMGVAHDPTILPVGKILNGELVDMNDGVIGLQAQIDDFSCDFRPYAGPDDEILYSAESSYDSRPFISHSSNADGKLSVSLNPCEFDKENFLDIENHLVEMRDVQIETAFRKSIVPDVQVLINLVSGVLVYLTVKKTFEKTSDKLSDRISDDVIKCYDGVKKIINFIYRKVTVPKTITYILSEPGQPIELVVHANNAETVMQAYENLASGEVRETVNKYICHLGDSLDKIQFIYDSENGKWDLNYITTTTGKVIGTAKCYKRAINLYRATLQASTAGFSIGGCATLSDEGNSNI